MSFSELGNIGEFISSIGVVISLVYLAIQIRKNTETERTTTYQSVVSDFAALNRTMSSTPELSYLYVTAMENFRELNPDERARVSQLFFASFHFFENMFYQHRKGYLEEEVWLGWKRMMLTYYARPGFSYWWNLRRDLFSNAFATFLETTDVDKVIPSYYDITTFDTMSNPSSQV